VAAKITDYTIWFCGSTGFYNIEKTCRTRLQKPSSPVLAFGIVTAKIITLD